MDIAPPFPDITLTIGLDTLVIRPGEHIVVEVSLLVIPAGKGDDLIGIALVIAVMLAGEIRPAGVEALEGAAGDLIALESVGGHAHHAEMHDLAHTHVVGNDRIIERILREGVLEHLRHVLLLHELRIGILEGGDCRLERAVGMGGAHAEALGLRRLDVRAVAVAAEGALTGADAQEQGIHLLALGLSGALRDQLPVLVDLLVERVLDLLHGHFVVDCTDFRG